VRRGAMTARVPRGRTTVARVQRPAPAQGDALHAWRAAVWGAAAAANGWGGRLTQRRTPRASPPVPLQMSKALVAAAAAWAACALAASGLRAVDQEQGVLDAGAHNPSELSTPSHSGWVNRVYQPTVMAVKWLGGAATTAVVAKSTSITATWPKATVEFGTHCSGNVHAVVSTGDQDPSPQILTLSGITPCGTACITKGCMCFTLLDSDDKLFTKLPKAVLDVVRLRLKGVGIGGRVSFVSSVKIDSTWQVDKRVTVTLVGSGAVAVEVDRPAIGGGFCINSVDPAPTAANDCRTGKTCMRATDMRGECKLATRPSRPCRSALHCAALIVRRPRPHHRLPAGGHGGEVDCSDVGDVARDREHCGRY
jgi:hypothetical protein